MQFNFIEKRLKLRVSITDVLVKVYQVSFAKWHEYDKQLNAYKQISF